ncbi:glycosyltransferase [Falsiroseomonas sp. HW251]|uniref:glycosyltransferase n=1 Tax=Falsiroseomonas sp. HW251 TaxID=3390998 RepID=UPI003D311613
MLADSKVATTRPLRLAHVTEAPGGGVLSYLQEAVAFQARSPDVAAVSVLGPEVNAAPIAAIDSPKLVVRTFEHRRGSVAGLLRLGRLTGSLLDDSRAEILHVHSTFAGVMARLRAAFSFRRPKVVYSPHGWAFSRTSSVRPLIVAAERLLACVTDRIVCVSHAEMADAVAEGIPASKCVVIENGIATLPAAPAVAAPKSARGGRLRVLFVGRFDRQKGFDFCLAVMARLGDAAECFAVGDYVVGPAEAQLAIPENVTLLGWRDRAEVVELYKHADLLIMPSRWEGLPIVALEAMRSGLPIFSTPVGGLRDVVVDGITGRLFELSDPETVAGMIRSVTRETLAGYAERGHRRFLERFTAERMNSETVALYRSIRDGGEAADRAAAATRVRQAESGAAPQVREQRSA